MVLEKRHSKSSAIFYLSPSRSLKPIVILLGFSWLIPILIIILFNLVASLVYKYVFNYSPSFIYSDVLENYDICFIKNLGAYLIGCCLPSVLLFFSSVLILISIAVFIRRRLFILRSSIVQLLGQQTTVNIIHDTAEFSLKMKLIIINGSLFVAVFIVNIIAAIHIRSGHISLFILFCLGQFIFALVVIVYMGFYFMFENSFNKNEMTVKNRYYMDDVQLDNAVDLNSAREEVVEERGEYQNGNENEGEAQTKSKKINFITLPVLLFII